MIASWRPACCSRLLARVHEHSWPIVCLLFQHFHKHNSLPYHLGMYERSSPSSKELYVGSRSYNNSLLPVFSFLCTWTIACTAKTGSALPPWSSIWFRLCRRRSPCRSRQLPPDCRAPVTACTSRSDESKIVPKIKIVFGFFGSSKDKLRDILFIDDILFCIFMHIDAFVHSLCSTTLFVFF